MQTLETAVLRTLRRAGVSRFERVWREHSEFPRNLCLSLSLACPSHCIYCSLDRGGDIRPRSMPMDIVEKIVAEAAQHGLAGHLSLSENGEALAHPEFRRILDTVRSALPDTPLVLFTNMVLMDEDTAAFILGKGVNYIHFNLDGATEASYQYIKRNNAFDKVKNNIRALFAARERLASSCRIGVSYVTARAFTEEIEGRTGEFPDEETDIREFFKPLLRPGDSIGPTPISLERFQDVLDRPNREPCRMFGRILDDLFVAPNGQAYICCVDYALTSDLGNLSEQSIRQIWSGPARRQLLENIYAMRYDRACRVCATCLPYTDYAKGAAYQDLKARLRSMFRAGRLRFEGTRLMTD